MGAVKGVKKAVIIWGLLGILVIEASRFVPATQALAEDVKYRAICYLTKVEAIPVGDVEGHVILVYERRGVAIFEDGECAAYLPRALPTLPNIKVRFRGMAS